MSDSRELQPKITVQKNRTVEIGIHKAVGFGPELLMHIALGETQRIEIGRQMTHHAVSTDQHQRTDRILCGPKRGLRR